MSDNITKEHLDTIFDTLPAEITRSEIFALILTLFDVYKVSYPERLEMAGVIMSATLEAAAESANATRN